MAEDGRINVRLDIMFLKDKWGVFLKWDYPPGSDELAGFSPIIETENAEAALAKIEEQLRSGVALTSSARGGYEQLKKQVHG